MTLLVDFPHSDTWAKSPTSEAFFSNVTLVPVNAVIPGTSLLCLQFDTDGVNQRNEIVLRASPEGQRFFLGQTYWHGQALYFPSGHGWEAITSARVVSQMHARNELTLGGNSNPGISIWARNDPAGDATKIQLNFFVSAYQNQQWSDSAVLGLFPLDVAHKIVMQFKMHWDIDQNPFCKVWVNDVLLYNKTVRTMYEYVAGTSQADYYEYLKRGIYDFGTPKHVLRMYSAQVRVGDSAAVRADVTPDFGASGGLVIGSITQVVEGDTQNTVLADSVSGATAYDLYWANAPGVTKASNKLPGVTFPFNHTGLTNGLPYYYAYAARNATDETGLSNEVSGTPSAAPSSPYPSTEDSNNGKEPLDTTAHTIALPATVTPGSLLLVALGLHSGGSVVTTTWDNASHGQWAPLVDKGDFATLRLVVYYKKADGSEAGGTLSVTTDVPCTSAHQSKSITNWDGETAPQASTPGSGPVTTTVDPPSDSPGLGSLAFLWEAIALISHTGGLSYTAYPAGYSDGAQFNSRDASGSEHVLLGTAEKQATADSEDPGVFTKNDATAARSVAVTIGIPPAAASGGGGGVPDPALGGEVAPQVTAAPVVLRPGDTGLVVIGTGFDSVDRCQLASQPDGGGRVVDQEIVSQATTQLSFDAAGGTLTGGTAYLILRTPSNLLSNAWPLTLLIGNDVPEEVKIRAYSDVITDRFGNVIEGAEVSLLDANGDLVPIYSDAFGAQPILGNIAKTDKNGTFVFYVLSGRYLRRVSGEGLPTQETPDIVIQDPAELLTAADLIEDYVVVGFLPTPSAPASLSMVTPIGVAYVQGQRLAPLSASHTYGASKDTYVDLDENGLYAYLEVANGAAAPAVTANGLRLFKAVTDGTGVTAVTDLRQRELRLKGDVLPPAPSYTVATVPAAADHPRAMIYVSDEAGGAVLAFSDGVGWRRITDRAFIS